jgi:fluoroquinolone transport system permease protein
VQPLKMVSALAPIDAKSVARDPLLSWLVLLPLLVALLARSLLLVLFQRIGETVGIPLLAYYPAAMSYCLLMVTPAMCGMVVGYLLLDQRDDRTLSALLVTPISAAGYLAYRLAAPMLVSWVVTLIALPVAGLVEGGILPLLMASLTAAPMAAMVALILASFAENKVQGFALMKVSGILFMAPIGSLFVPSTWQLALGVVPTYWSAKLYWSAGAGDPTWWVYLVVGLLYQGALLALLLRRFDRVMHR